MTHKLRLYRRAEGGAWHCATYWKGKEWRRSTKEKNLDRAKAAAEAWYLELTGKARPSGRTASPKRSRAAGDGVGTHKTLCESLI